jgi:hypothetical protein
VKTVLLLHPGCAQRQVPLALRTPQSDSPSSESDAMLGEDEAEEGAWRFWCWCWWWLWLWWLWM